MVAVTALLVYHVGIRRSARLVARPPRRGLSAIWAQPTLRVFVAMFVVGFLAQLRLDVMGRLSEVLPL